MTWVVNTKKPKIFSAGFPDIREVCQRYNAMDENSALNVPLHANWGAWPYMVRAEPTEGIEDDTCVHRQFHAVGLQTAIGGRIVSIQSDRPAQLVVPAGEGIPRR